MLHWQFIWYALIFLKLPCASDVCGLTLCVKRFFYQLLPPFILHLIQLLASWDAYCAHPASFIPTLIDDEAAERWERDVAEKTASEAHRVQEKTEELWASWVEPHPPSRTARSRQPTQDSRPQSQYGSYCCRHWAVGWKVAPQTRQTSCRPECHG